MSWGVTGGQGIDEFNNRHRDPSSYAFVFGVLWLVFVCLFVCFALRWRFLCGVALAVLELTVFSQAGWPRTH